MNVQLLEFVCFVRLLSHQITIGSVGLVAFGMFAMKEDVFAGWKRLFGIKVTDPTSSYSRSEDEAEKKRASRAAVADDASEVIVDLKPHQPIN